MILPFRQGIVKFPKNGSGQQVFLDPGNGTMSIVANTDLILSFAHGSGNYLFKEESYGNAWTGIPVTGDKWLYWDIHTRTGLRTFGYTTLEPVSSPTAPLVTLPDLHWFDTSTFKMRVRDQANTMWVEKIRVFACKVEASGVIAGMGILSADGFTGTQVGVELENDAGFIMFNPQSNKPVVQYDGAFITSSSQWLVQNPTSAGLVTHPVESYQVAATNLEAGRAVITTAAGVSYAGEYSITQQKTVGITRKSALAGQAVPVVYSGSITSNWNLNADPDSPVYIGANGVLYTQPQHVDQPALGKVLQNDTVVIGRSEIVIDSGSGGSPVAGWTILTANHTAVNSERLMCNTSAAGFTVTLPAGPVAGDTVVFADYLGTFNINNLTVAPNGNKIMGVIENLILDVKEVTVTFEFINSTKGWLVS